MNVFYDYLLHRLYRFPLKHKSDTSNGESIFVPVGIDDLSILKSLFTKYASADLIYEDKIQIPQERRNNKDELTVEDNQDFFRKLKEKGGSALPIPKTSNLALNTSLMTEKVE